MMLRVLAALAGVAILAVVGRALLLELLVPRPSRSILTRMTQWGTQGAISLVARWVPDYFTQHRILTGLGPVTVFATLFIAVLGFLVAFSLLIFAFDGGAMSDALLQAGSALMTLGIVQVSDPAQVAVTLVAAFTGMVIIAVLVGYLLMLFTAYNSRESGVTKSTMWAGEPAWGPELLCRRALGAEGRLDPQVDGWLDWVCELRVWHTTYPVLAYFRSAGPLRGWVTTLVARLDAACLELALVRHIKTGDLSALLAEGVQTMEVLRRSLTKVPMTADRSGHSPTPHLRRDGLMRPGDALYRAIRADGRRSTRYRIAEPPNGGMSTLTRADFEHVVSLLQAAGLDLQDDIDRAWDHFRRLRGQYEANAYVIAYRTHAVPAPWTGPRRGSLQTIWPTASVELLDS